MTEIPSGNIFHQSIVNGDLQTVKRILKEQQSWEVIDNEGETVLHLAFKCKNNILSCQDSIIQTLGCLLDEGLSIDLKNAVGRTVLFLAVENRLRRVIDFAVERGADVNTRDQNDNSIVHLLIEDQSKRYYENCIKNGGSILRQCVDQEDISFLNWLLSKGVDVDIQNNNGETAFSMAIERNLHHVMPTLMSHINNADYIKEKGRKVIEAFFKVKVNMNARNDTCYESRYETEVVQFLLEKGVSVDHINNILVLEFLKSRDPNPEIVRMVLQRYTNLNTQDRDGDTALHLLVRDRFAALGQYKNQAVEVVRALLSKGVNVSLKNNIGETIVRLAIQVKHFEVLKALLEHGGDVSSSANPGALFLHDISSVPSIEDEIWAPMVDSLVQAGWDVNAVRPDSDFTPLMEACMSSNLAIAQKLIDNKANVNYAEKQNLRGPIHVTAGNLTIKHTNAATLMEILVRSGAEVNAKNKRGETALHLATFRGYYAMNKLLQLGAHVDARDNAGCLPLQRAVKAENVGAIKALLQFGADVNNPAVLKEMRKFRVGTVDHLTQHWLKLKAAKLPMMGGYANFAKKVGFQQYYVECAREVEALKTHRLNDQTTLYQLLHMNINFKYVFIKENERLKELVESPLLKTTFPKYHTLISACYNKAIIRHSLIELAKKAWHCLTGIEFNQVSVAGRESPDCVERILAYLDNEDLRIMAGKEEEGKPLKRTSQLTLNEPAKRRRL